MREHLPAVAAALWLLLMAVATMMPLDAFLGGPLAWVLVNDWTAHVVLFGGLAVCSMLVLRVDARRGVVRTFVGGLAFGAAIEVVQALLPWERGAEWSDVAADGMGLLLGLVFYVVWKRVRPAPTPARR